MAYSKHHWVITKTKLIYDFNMQIKTMKIITKVIFFWLVLASMRTIILTLTSRSQPYHLNCSTDNDNEHSKVLLNFSDGKLGKSKTYL